MADRFERWLEQNERAIVISLLVLFAAVSVLRAATLRFWFDELITVYLSRASLGELWSAMLDGTEQQAFLASLIFRPFASSTLWPEVVARIPSIAGYVAMLGGIYAFARYRWSATVSLIAMLAPCLTRSVDYAQQARSYALAMGLCAWALVCWQRSASEARRGPWLLGLWFTLSAAILCHYFAVLLLVPLAMSTLTFFEV